MIAQSHTSRTNCAFQPHFISNFPRGLGRDDQCPTNIACTHGALLGNPTDWRLLRVADCKTASGFASSQHQSFPNLFFLVWGSFWQKPVAWNFSSTLRPGDLEDVKDQLQGVVQIQRTDAAFAAILVDGRVIAWGNASMLDRKDWGYYCIYIYLKRPFPSNLWEESRKPVFGRVIYRQPGFLVENRVLWLQPFFQPLFFPPRWSNGPLVCSLAISKLLEGVGGVASGKWVNSKHVRS